MGEKRATKSPKSTDDQGDRKRVDRIKALLAHLREVAPDEPQYWQTGAPFSEEELQAMEQKRGARLPESYRLYLLEIGDGGAGFSYHGSCCGGIPALRESKGKWIKPFPLTSAWADPDDIGEWKAEGAYAKNKQLFYKLPRGVDATDGTLPFGHTSDHADYHLVLNGPHAGTVWVDGRGYDLGRVAPAVPADVLRRGHDPEKAAEPIDFLELDLLWLEAKLKELTFKKAIADAVRENRLEAYLAKNPGSRKLLDEVRREAARRLHAELEKESWDPNTLRDVVAPLRAAGARLTAAQALMAMGEWKEALEVAAAELEGSTKHRGLAAALAGIASVMVVERPEAVAEASLDQDEMARLALLVARMPPSKQEALADVLPLWEAGGLLVAQPKWNVAALRRVIEKLLAGNPLRGLASWSDELLDGLREDPARGKGMEEAVDRLALLVEPNRRYPPKQRDLVVLRGQDAPRARRAAQAWLLGNAERLLDGSKLPDDLVLYHGVLAAKLESEDVAGAVRFGEKTLTRLNKLKPKELSGFWEVTLDAQAEPIWDLTLEACERSGEVNTGVALFVAAWKRLLQTLCQSNSYEPDPTSVRILVRMMRMLKVVGDSERAKQLAQAARKSLPPFDKKDLARILAGKI